MNFRINSSGNFYNSLLTNRQGMNRKNKTSVNIDFTSMGTIRDAVIIQNSNDKVESRLGNSENNVPTYSEKFTVCGVDITDNIDSNKVAVPLSDDIKNKLDKIVRENLEQQGYVEKDNHKLTEKRIKYQNEYLNTLNKEERPKALWSIGAYLNSESDKYEAKIRKLDPKWDWGQPIKKEILGEVFGAKLDVSV